MRIASVAVSLPLADRSTGGSTCILSLASHYDAVDACSEPLQAGLLPAFPLRDAADEFEIRPTPDRVPGLLFVSASG
jgi:hypothetical protein